MYAAGGERTRQRGFELFGGFDTAAMGTVRLRVPNDVRAREIDPIVVEPHHGLLQPNHPEATVVKHHDDQVELQPDRGVEFAAGHHEAAIAHNGEHMLIGVHQLCSDRRGHPSAH